MALSQGMRNLIDEIDRGDSECLDLFLAAIGDISRGLPPADATLVAGCLFRTLRTTKQDHAFLALASLNEIFHHFKGIPAIERLREEYENELGLAVVGTTRRHIRRPATRFLNQSRQDTSS